MDEAPVSCNQGAFVTTEVGSPSPSESAVTEVSCPQFRNDVSALPTGDAEQCGTRSTDGELCKELNENGLPSPSSCSSSWNCQLSPTSQKSDIAVHFQNTGDSRVLPDTAGGVEIAGFATGIQTNSSSIASDSARSSRSDCPLLKSLLIWGHRSGDTVAEQTAAGQAELALGSTGSCHRQDLGNLSRQTMGQNGADVADAVQPAPNTICNARGRLNSRHLRDIRKMARIFRRAMRLPPCCRQQAPSSFSLYADRFDFLEHLVVHARNSVLCLLRFACQLPQLHRKPPHVQVTLLKRASAGCMILHLAQSYNCQRSCWLDSHGAEFRPQDLTRLVPSPTLPELWNDVAALGVFLKSLVCTGSERLNGNDDFMVRFFSLLNAVLIMSPENVPFVHGSDRDTAADISDFQQSCILLLRCHLQESLSVARAAKLLPTLLTRLVAIRSLAVGLRNALLSERMVCRDSVLGDALSLELAMC